MWDGNILAFILEPNKQVLQCSFKSTNSELLNNFM